MNELLIKPFSQQIFEHGIKYYMAASKLDDSNDQSITIPICTLAAFAIECFLKSLLLDDNGNGNGNLVDNDNVNVNVILVDNVNVINLENPIDYLTKRSGVDVENRHKKHLLTDLFEMLDPSKKAYINQKYESKDFENDLALISNYFVDTRYFFQNAVDTHALVDVLNESYKIAIPIQHFDIKLVMDITDFLYSLILSHE